MSFRITGLSPEDFAPLFGLDDDALAARGVFARIADSHPGYPCRITLEDAAPGERILLLHHERHKAATPFRSAYAIYVRENAQVAATYTDELPPVFRNRPIALRMFNAEGMLVGADMGMNDAVAAKIEAAFLKDEVAYLHAHNAMHGCFAAEIRRA